jgi:hypothetical protein
LSTFTLAKELTKIFFWQNIAFFTIPMKELKRIDMWIVYFALSSTNGGQSKGFLIASGEGRMS